GRRAERRRGEGECEPWSCRSLSHEGRDIASGWATWLPTPWPSWARSADTVAGQRRPCTGFAICPPAFRRRHPTRSSVGKGRMVPNGPPTLGRRAAILWWTGDLTARGHLLRVAVERRLPGVLAEHGVEHLLGGEGVSASAGTREQMAVAVPVVVIQADPMAAVVPGEDGLEPLDLHPVGLVRVAHCLLDLAHHARMH